MKTGKMDSSTHQSLLASLMSGRSASLSWPLFVEKYGRIVYRWSVRWGAGPQDAEDIVQETLLLVYRKLEQYYNQPRGNFRSWLKTVAFRCWAQILQSQEAARGNQNAHFMEPNAMRLIVSIEAREELIEAFDRVARDETLDLAFGRVRARVEPLSWQCFQLTYMEQLSGAEVAERLGMKTSAVFANVCRIRKMLKNEIETIDSEPDQGFD